MKLAAQLRREKILIKWQKLIKLLLTTDTNFDPKWSLISLLLYRSLFDTSERGGWFDDQLYLRKLKNVHNDIAKIEILPSELFPTWYVHMNRGSDIDNFRKTWGNKYLLHYNYIKGWQKKRKMKDQDSWISGDTIK